MMAEQPAPSVTPAAPLRIALVGPLPPPSGGMANQTLQLARLLEADGQRMEVVQVNAPYRPAWVGRIQGLRAVFRLLPYLAALWRAMGRADVAHVMANSGWSWHLFAAPAVWIARWRGVPVVVNYRGGYAAEFLAASRRWIAPTLRRADALMVPSGFLKQVFADFGFAATVVPNAVDLERFGAAGESAPDAAVNILVTRNLEPLYDNATALEAFARVARAHPDATLTIAGSGPEEARLKAQAEGLGLATRVTFTGRVDSQDMPALYRRAGIALNPSQVDNMPNSVLEAMAAGVAVVSTRVGGVPYIVEDGETALLVPPHDATAMAAALERLLDDPHLRARLAANGLRQVQQYAWPRVRDRLLGLYRDVLDSRPSQPHRSADPCPR